MRTPIVVIVALIALRSSALAGPTAEELFDEAQSAYHRADYATAITKWTEAYRLSGEPALLYNLAQAHRLAGDCARALATYREFIAADPTSEQRPLADEFIHELEPRCGTAAPPLPTPPPTIVGAVPATSGRSFEIAGLVTSAAGVLTLAVGLGLGHHASTVGAQVTASCSTGCDWASLRGKDASGRRYAAVGRALDVLGAAAIVGGGIMYFVGDRRSAITVAPRPREGGAAVVWSGSW